MIANARRSHAVLVLGSVLALAAGACGETAAKAPPASRSLALHCSCDEAEDCPACFRRIADCCYENEDITEKIPRLARRCEGDPACEVCCAECARMSCEDLIASDSCPPVAPGS